MTALYLDIETWSECPLPREGVYRYATDPSTRVTVVAWVLGDGPVEWWDYRTGIPEPLLRALADPKVIKWAHNAQFERVVLGRVWGIPLDPAPWRCSMVLASMLGLRKGLGELAQDLALSEGKLDEDKSLMKRFAIPPGTPDATHELWADWVRYCRRDTEVCRAAVQRMLRFAPPESEWRAYALDQRINDRGLPVDVPFVQAANAAAQGVKTQAKKEAAKVTGLDNPNSRAKLLDWAADQGVALPNLQKTTVEEALADESLPEQVRAALHHRTQFSRASLGKYEALLRRVTKEDPWLRGSLQFYGAHTGRWAGRDVQPHNLPRGTIFDPEALSVARSAVLSGDLDWMYSDPAEVLSTLVRTSFAPPEGYRFVVCDYVSIEAVMMAWAAERGRLWDTLVSKRDPYKDFAAELFGVPYDDVTKAQRTLAKPAVLGCQYRLGAQGLGAYAAGFGLALDEEESTRQVRLYRNTYPEVPRFWAGVELAAYEAIQERSTATYRGFRFRYEMPYLFIDLPSGRSLAYLQPRIEIVPKPWEIELPDGTTEQATGPGITYRTPLGRTATHSGKITENIIQALARDVLVYGLQRLDNVFHIVGHVHDEVIVLVPEDYPDPIEGISSCLTASPWCADAPIEVEGGSGNFYRKF